MSGLKPCNNCGCDQIQYREEGAYLPFYRYCRNCLAQGPVSDTYEGAGQLWDKLNSFPSGSSAPITQQKEIDQLKAQVERLKWAVEHFDEVDECEQILHETPAQSLAILTAEHDARLLDRLVDKYEGFVKNCGTDIERASMNHVAQMVKRDAARIRNEAKENK